MFAKVFTQMLTRTFARTLPRAIASAFDSVSTQVVTRAFKSAFAEVLIRVPLRTTIISEVPPTTGARIHGSLPRIYTDLSQGCSQEQRVRFIAHVVEFYLATNNDKCQAGWRPPIRWVFGASVEQRLRSFGVATFA